MELLFGCNLEYLNEYRSYERVAPLTYRYRAWEENGTPRQTLEVFGCFEEHQKDVTVAVLTDDDVLLWKYLQILDLSVGHPSLVMFYMFRWLLFGVIGMLLGLFTVWLGYFESRIMCGLVGFFLGGYLPAQFVKLWGFSKFFFFFRRLKNKTGYIKEYYRELFEKLTQAEDYGVSWSAKKVLKLRLV